MNERAFTRDQLEAVFQKYKDVPNINRIRFLGQISPAPKNKPFVNLAAGDNPLFRHTKNEDGESVTNARIVLDFPSLYRIKKNTGTPFLSRFAVFSFVPKVVDALQSHFDDPDIEHAQALAGVGRLVSYDIYSKTIVPRKFVQMIENLCAEFDASDDAVAHAFRLFQMGRNNNAAHDTDVHNIMHQVSIVSNEISVGDMLVKKLKEQNRPTLLNEVELQGLVYMPPNIRREKITNERTLQFRLRIKQPREEWTPRTFVSEDGYDYFNVVATGSQADEWYPIVKQGQPVHVKGALEQSLLARPLVVTDKARTVLATILGAPRSLPAITEIDNYLSEHRKEFYQHYALGFIRATSIERGE